MTLSNDLFTECFVPEEKWEQLKVLANNENWDYKNDTTSYKYPILRNYIIHTYKRLIFLQEAEPNSNFINIKDKWVCFNTGLLTDNYEEIYMLWAKNHVEGKQPWFCKGFFKESDKYILRLGTLPERAYYFNSLNDLILNTKLEIIPNLDHILNDPENLSRIPKDIRNSPYLLQSFNGALVNMKKRLKANYKIAVPHYYNNKIQLLLPICLTNQTQPDVVLAVERVKSCYRGSTCLTLDMAYNNARLIAKPETDWLAR